MNAFRDAARTVSAWAVLFLVISVAEPASAQEDVIQFLKGALADVNKKLDDALKRIDQLEKEKAASSAKIEQIEDEKSATTARLGRVEESVKGVQSSPSMFNPAIGMVIDATAEYKGKAGGNFNFRAAEMGLSASVDPFARAYAFVNGNNDGVEVEEAAMYTTALPWNITAKAGRFFADFGRIPKYHQDALPFVNFPLAVDRFIGGESQADGAEVYYLFPTPFFLRGTLGVMNKIGAENERIDNTKHRALSRFTYMGRLASYFDLADNHSVEIGSSLAYTPSVRISGAGSGGYRALGGVDLTYRYQPLGSTLYQGLVWGSELFANSERFASDDSVKRRNAYGGYSYLEGKLNKNWSTGFLFDFAPNIDRPSERTFGYSPFLTWQISEFNRLRFQYSYLSNNFRADKDERGNQLYVQWTTVMGADVHGFRVR